MKKCIQKQLVRAGFVKEQSKIDEEAKKKQNGKQEWVEDEDSSIQAAVNKSLDDTAKRIASSIIPDEFTMVMFQKLVETTPHLNNLLGAFFATLMSRDERETRRAVWRRDC